MTLTTWEDQTPNREALLIMLVGSPLNKNWEVVIDTNNIIDNYSNGGFSSFLYGTTSLYLFMFSKPETNKILPRLTKLLAEKAKDTFFRKLQSLSEGLALTTRMPPMRSLISSSLNGAVHTSNYSTPNWGGT